MSCENLVCASCAGRVVEGRCRVCRAARLNVHDHQQPLPAGPLLATAAVLVLLVLLLNLL